MAGFRIQDSGCTINKGCIFIFILVLFIMHYASFASAGTIKVLILDEKSPRMPQKNEQLEKISKNMNGELFFGGNHYKGGIEVWKGQNGLYVVNEVPLEEYVKGVTKAEIGPNWEMEAMKAQAVISRTYAVYQKMMNGNSFYHLTSTVLHQVYKGNSTDETIAFAVNKTAGEILTYEGKPIEAFYHSTAGEKTELPDEVFGKSYPYLRSVESICESSPYSMWERKIQVSEIERALNLSGIEDIKVISHTSTGRAKELSITTQRAQSIVKATELRKLLGWQRLPSTNFKITKNADLIIFEGKGYGHGVGLCQWSALEMAKKGMNYRDILAYFYPGTEIRLYEGR